jgi:hypothetical protein
MKDKPETDCERVLRLLKAAGELGISAHHDELGKGLRLSARILDLRKKWIITTEHRDNKVCIYVLVGEKPDVLPEHDPLCGDAQHSSSLGSVCGTSD